MKEAFKFLWNSKFMKLMNDSNFIKNILMIIIMIFWKKLIIFLKNINQNVIQKIKNYFLSQMNVSLMIV